MPKKLNTQTFIEKARKVHDNKYDYTLVAYVNSKTKILIRCPLHNNVFEQQPDSHLMGRGCQQCWDDRRPEAFRSGFESVKNRAIKIFGDKFLEFYNPVGYTTQQSLLTLDCKVPGHGPSTITWQNHIRGVSCSKCSMGKTNAGKTKSHETFMEEIGLVDNHKDKYDYSRTVYKLVHQKVEIICKTHNESFWMTPQKHLDGQGCPKCAVYGYSKSRPGNFYVLHEANITKIGITCREPTDRVQQINVSGGRNFKLLKSFKFDDGEIPWQIEDTLLKELRILYKQPTDKFDGYTECFYDVDHNALLARIQELIEQQSTEIA